MTIAPDLVAQILRLHTAEKWRVGTIARQLHVHRDTVRRVLAQTAQAVPRHPCGPAASTRTGPSSSRRWPSSPRSPPRGCTPWSASAATWAATSHFRHLMAELRPRPPAEAYLRLRTLPGEQAQVDWGHFGHLQIGRARRPLMAFVMVLSHSRMIFLRFFLDAAWTASCAAMSRPSRLRRRAPGALYDNLKSAVLERVGDAIRFNPSCWPWPATTASSRVRWRWRAAMRRAGSSAPSATSATASSPGARSPTWTTSTRRPGLVPRPGRRSALARGQRLERAPGLRGRGPQLMALPEHEPSRSASAWP
jgi:hypothetical protein